MIVDGSKYASTWQCFRSIFEKEGLRGYWRGNTINMIRIIPQGAVAFVAKDFYKEKLGGENPSSLALAAASMASGMTCMTAIYPLDLVRGRVTTTPGAYRGMFDGVGPFSLLFFCGSTYCDGILVDENVCETTTYTRHSCTRLHPRRARERSTKGWALQTRGLCHTSESLTAFLTPRRNLHHEY